MRIALIYFRENYTPAPPMGILYLGTVLRNAGHEVKVIDSFPAYHQRTLKIVKDFQPKLIGLSVLTTGHRIASYYTPILRREFPNALLCWGGVHPTALSKEVLIQQNLDFVVVGEGEETILEVCRNLDSHKGLGGIRGILFRNDGKIIDNGQRSFIEDLDTLPFPDRRLLEYPNFSWYLSPPGIIRGYFLKGITTFYTSRGCPFNCIFCCSHRTAGRKFRQRSITNVLEEIRRLVYDFKIKGLYFNDDTFGLDKVWLFDFCRLLRKEKFRLIWGCQTRANLASREMFRMMKDAGCIQVDIGAESGSEKVLENLKKGITPQDIECAFKTAQEVGLKTFATFVLGCPGETKEDIKKTEKLSKKISSQVSFLILVPYPGSELFKMAKENNWFTEPELVFSEDWANKQSEHPVMEINFSKEELLKIRTKLQNMFFIKNNLSTLLSFLTHPIYLLRMLTAILRHPVSMLVMVCKSFWEAKTALILENFYQKFNEELMN